jgi:hypothetical protein
MVTDIWCTHTIEVRIVVVVAHQRYWHHTAASLTSPKKKCHRGRSRRSSIVKLSSAYATGAGSFDSDGNSKEEMCKPRSKEDLPPDRPLQPCKSSYNAQMKKLKKHSKSDFTPREEQHENTRTCWSRSRLTKSCGNPTIAHQRYSLPHKPPYGTLTLPAISQPGWCASPAKEKHA